MLTKDALDTSIYEIRVLIDRMEAVYDAAPAGALVFKRYPSGERVPFLSTGSRGHRRVTRIDPADTALLDIMAKKAFARIVLPKLYKALKALKCAHEYEPVNLYRIAAELPPEFRGCADYYLGRPAKPKANPAFDCLQERQNPYEYDKNAVRTELGLFRSKSESLDAEIITNLGVEFKYEVTLLVGTKWINVDFVVNIYWKQQIGIIEHHGLLDDYKYRKKKKENLDTMMNHGIYPGQNLLILSESAEYGFDYEMTKRLLTAFCLSGSGFGPVML